MTTSSTAGRAVATRRSWQDWTNVVLGAYLALAPIWTTEAPTWWFVSLGILVAVAAVWALMSASSSASEWVQIVLGVLVFLAPWFGGAASVAAAAWTAWIIGVLVVVLAATAMVSERNR